jgi:hypothetical protein
MSFFTIVRDEKQGGPVVHECHLNYWALPGYWSDRFLVDVGLLLENGSTTEINQFEMGLPCGTTDNALQDLSELTKQPATLTLVFGHPVTVTGDTIDFGSGSVLFTTISSPESKRLADWSNDSFSLWRIKLSEPMQAGTKCYVRVRFRVASLGRTWMWKRSIMSKNGARVDLRVSDVREAWAVPGREALVPRMCPIEKLFAFIMIPGWLEPALVSPVPHYVRILETRAWRTYIERNAVGNARQLLIYQWRQEKVTSKNSFQGFMELRRAVPLHHAWNHVRTAAVVIVCVWLLSLFGPGQPLASVTTALSTYATRVWTILAGAGVLAIIGQVKQVKAIVKPSKEALTKFEDWLLGLRSAS